MHVVALSLLLLAGLPKVEPKPIPWLVDGTYVPESAVYELPCAKTLVDLCQVLAIGIDYSSRLVAEDGVLSQESDGELSPRIFLPEAVTAESAEGLFAEPGWPPHEELEYRGQAYTRAPSARVRLWRDRDGIVVRWVSLQGGRHGERVTTERFVPKSRLRAAGEARATELGVSLAGCSRMDKFVAPRFGACPIEAPRGAK